MTDTPATTSRDDDGIPPELARLRHSIDNIDAALIYLLAERFKATKQVGVLKAQRGLPASDPGREERQVARLRELARTADLDPVFAEKLLAFIVAEVIRHHEALAQDHAQDQQQD
ncbi:chorismate mutase [Cellulomonas sp. DKR-3]|uniref:Chorismate mutase n=1 Tax=Cellulomonas fulva TaxID=2835530 RepID=A0ABS5U2P8_9CELL|nr:chorismate mutase [Cellulomonas fulva]MBT0995670.1 chorismate mutase [Cellulomonas fulva]